MITVSKVSVSLSRYNDGDVLIKSTNINNKMTGNPFFPDPVPGLDKLPNLITAFTDAVAEAENFDRNKVAIKNTLRKRLLRTLNIMGMYINLTADGDIDMLSSTGFEVNKAPEPVTIDAPRNLRLSQGKQPGDLVCTIAAVKGAKSYLYLITEHPITEQSVWQSTACSRCTHTFQGLTSGKQYWVKVAAVGARGQLVYSLPVSIYVQ